MTIEEEISALSDSELQAAVDRQSDYVAALPFAKSETERVEQNSQINLRNALVREQSKREQPRIAAALEAARAKAASPKLKHSPALAGIGFASKTPTAKPVSVPSPSSPTASTKPTGDFMALARERAKATGASLTGAINSVRRENPGLHTKWLEEQRAAYATKRKRA